MGLDSGSSGPLLESTGWLAAHRRNQSLLRGPIDLRRDSLSGRPAPTVPRPPRDPADWRAWGMRLFIRPAP
ncbi:MAG: hypothetical protein KKF41_04185 [Actinobacteria bacterium]|nr:hypothetical protein [Actinomycetota bacterium]MBU1943408.1 hypothetical protein [Actinomycetota bacterium]MBU2686765.1 hypothetical protein [Actinomycetota bacterium]